MERYFDRNHLSSQINVPRWRTILLCTFAEIDNFLPTAQSSIDDPEQRPPIHYRFPFLRPRACGDVNEVLARLWMVGFGAPDVTGDELLHGGDPDAEFFHVHGHGFTVPLASRWNKSPRRFFL